MGAFTELKRKISLKREMANFRGAVFYAQRRVQNLRTRQRIATFVSRFLPKGTSEYPGTAQLVEELDREGFVMLDDLVTPGMALKMREHFRSSVVHSPYVYNSPRLLIDDPNLPDSHFFIHDDQTVLSCPHALEIANNPKILAAMEAELGCKPTIGYMTAWWSVPTADGIALHAENFHRDVDDVKFIKLFVYLTDVDLENGPHDFIRGSHADPRLPRIRRYTDKEMWDTFGNNALVRFTGKAGTAFLENTYGMHRGLHVRSGRRLMFQIIYTVLRSAYGPARPYPAAVATPTSFPIDPYINRQYLRL
jgi:hypothetical protein